MRTTLPSIIANDKPGHKSDNQTLQINTQVQLAKMHASKWKNK